MTAAAKTGVPKVGGNGLMRGGSAGLSSGAPKPAPVTTDRTGAAVPGVSGRLDTLLRSDNPYLERRRTRALQYANRRGLRNSSIAAGAAEAAAIDAAVPIASADADIAARERGMRSSEFMQTRDHRVQQLMQERGFGHDAAQREADRELQTLMQTRDHRVQQLMQTERFDHDTAQRQADRELQTEMQQRGFTHGARESRRERRFRGREAGRDRVLTREQIAQADERLQASREESNRNAVQGINQLYIEARLQVQQNPDLDQDARDRILEDMARQRDVALNMSRRVGNYSVTWPSDDPESDGAIIGG